MIKWQRTEGSSPQTHACGVKIYIWGVYPPPTPHPTGSGRLPPMMHHQMAPEGRGQRAASAGFSRAHNTEAIARAKGAGTGAGTGGKSNLAGQIIPVYGFGILLYILYILFKVERWRHHIAVQWWGGGKVFSTVTVSVRSHLRGTASHQRAAVLRFALRTWRERSVSVVLLAFSNLITFLWIICSDGFYFELRLCLRLNPPADYELAQLQEKLRETELVMENIVSKAHHSPDRWVWPFHFQLSDSSHSCSCQEELLKQEYLLSCLSVPGWRGWQQIRRRVSCSSWQRSLGWCRRASWWRTWLQRRRRRVTGKVYSLWSYNAPTWTQNILLQHHLTSHTRPLTKIQTVMNNSLNSADYPEEPQPYWEHSQCCCHHSPQREAEAERRHTDGPDLEDVPQDIPGGADPEGAVNFTAVCDDDVGPEGDLGTTGGVDQHKYEEGGSDVDLGVPEEDLVGVLKELELSLQMTSVMEQEKMEDLTRLTERETSCSTVRRRNKRRRAKKASHWLPACKRQLGPGGG